MRRFATKGAAAGWQIAVKLQQAIVILAGFTLVLGIATIVTCRYVIPLEFYGTEEIILTAAVWFYFLAASYTTYRKEHITAQALDLVAGSKAPVVRRISSILFPPISFFVCGLTFYLSYDYTCWVRTAGMSSPVLNMPTFINVMCVTVAMGLMSIYFLIELVNNIKGIAIKPFPRTER